MSVPASRLAALALVFGLTFAAPAWAVQFPAQPLSFTVLRDGDAVGTHVLRFQPQADGVTVDIQTKVLVKIAMIPVYRFEHHGHEQWRASQLVELDSTTNDDGTQHSVKAAADAGALDVKGDGHDSRLPAAILPASLWNRDAMSQSMLMNTLDGHAMKVNIADMGEDSVTVHGNLRPAHHYAMTGDLSRELWYDGQGTLVQVRFKAKDDSDIRYVLN